MHRLHTHKVWNPRARGRCTPPPNFFTTVGDVPDDHYRLILPQVLWHWFVLPLIAAEELCTYAKSVGVVLPATLTFGTAAAEIMECVGGSCEYKLDGTDEWKTSGAGDSFQVPANSKFDIRVTEAYHYICHYA